LKCSWRLSNPRNCLFNKKSSFLLTFHSFLHSFFLFEFSNGAFISALLQVVSKPIDPLSFFFFSYFIHENEVSNGRRTSNDGDDERNAD
jgi:hypothetical protein